MWLCVRVCECKKRKRRFRELAETDTGAPTWPYTCNLWCMKLYMTRRKGCRCCQHVGVPQWCVPKSLTFCLTSSPLLNVFTTLVILEWRAEGPTEIRLREGLRKDVTGCCPPPDMSTPHAWVLHHLDTRYLRRVRASIWCVSQWTLELSRKHVTNLSTGHAQTPLLASSYILHQPTTQLSPSDGPSSPVVKNF